VDAPSSREQPRGSRLVGILVSLVAILVTLGIAEVILRSTHALGARPSWSEPDSIVGFRFTPKRPYWSLAENDHPITGRINSLGWRDRERSLEKPPGTYRVAFLGDSMVEAFQVESDSTFLALAEDDLTSRLGVVVEIMNLGRSGAAQAEELLLLQSDAMGFSPDLVAVFFNPLNDIGDAASNTTGSLRPFFKLSSEGELCLDTSFNRSRAYRARAAINGPKQRSALVSLLVERYNTLERSGRLKAEAAPEGQLPRYLTLCASQPDSAYAANYGLCKTLMREMAGYCERNGAGFLLVCGPSVYRPEDLCACAAVDSTFDACFFESDLARLADSLGVDYLGLQTAFAEHSAAKGRPLHWSHFNYAGHRVVARALSGKLAEIILEREQDGEEQTRRL
jgi:hypothetical protein